MSVGVVKILLCVLFVTSVRTNGSKFKTLSSEEINQFLEYLDPNNALSNEDMQNIVNYYLKFGIDMSNYVPRVSSSKNADYSPGDKTEWYKVKTEPVTEKYKEVFQPTLPVETSTMSREEVEKLIETMDSNYRPTPYERQMIFKYFLLPNQPLPPEDPYEPSADDDVNYHWESTTKLDELMAEPVTEKYKEAFQSTLPVETSTMSREEVEKLIETMDSNYRPTPYERQMIFKYFLLPNQPSSPEDPYEPSADEEANYHSEPTTESYELTTEPVTEKYKEGFQPTLPVETSTMSREEVEKLIETMDSNYRPTPYERQMIFKYFLLPNQPLSPEDPYEPSADEEVNYHSEPTTEFYELTTEPFTEEYVEVFQPTHEEVLHVQEHPSPVQEHPSPVQEHPSPVQEHPSPVQEQYGKERPAFYGSSRGIAGYNFPNYYDIPQTSFTCMDKDIIPGFYADLESGCQAFHMCWPHRRESFLCPVGTVFNQALLACDYWYNFNCSMAPLYYSINAHAYNQIPEESESRNVISSMIHALITKGEHDEAGLPIQTDSVGKDTGKTEQDMSYVMKLLPIKAKVTVYPETSVQKSKIVAEASVGKKKVLKPIHVVEKPAVQTYRYVPAVKPVHTPSVSQIVDEIFTVAKKIVEESHGLASSLKVEQTKVHKPKPVPLTQLNPRFIAKPVMIEKINEESVKNLEEIAQRKFESDRLVKKLLYKPAVQATPLKKVSPITRRALAGSYLKLLKRKGF